MLRLKRKRNKRLGFLLLEVLVSVTMISVGLIYVVRSFSASTRAITTSAKFLNSVSMLEEKLWELEAKGAIERGRYRGSITTDDEYSWEAEVEGLENAPINSLKLKVGWKGPQKRRQGISIETYLWNEEE
ncbi:MAG: type II secretion system protein [Candidatus Omnitrophica bacterium]|nr:type II secretion system protein [Candidatus Omnitrophota bacterium]